MINEKTLRIGNYFHGGMNELLVVSEIHQTGVYYYEIPSGAGWCAYIAAEAIKLTGEWLLRLGFERDGFGGYSKDISIHKGQMKILYFNLDYLYIREGQKKEPRADDHLCVLWNKDVMKEFYVHELQNLYFALTRKELTA